MIEIIGVVFAAFSAWFIWYAVGGFMEMAMHRPGEWDQPKGRDEKEASGDE